jgi:hypothetical protein
MDQATEASHRLLQLAVSTGLGDWRSRRIACSHQVSSRHLIGLGHQGSLTRPTGEGYERPVRDPPVRAVTERPSGKAHIMRAGGR